MAEPLSVNPEQISASSGAFHALADTAEEISSGLKNAVDNAGPWEGSDPFGEKFAAVLRPAVSGLGNAISGVALFAHATGDNLTATAAAYKATDESISDNVPHPISLENR
jgi:hypothetical protein